MIMKCPKCIDHRSPAAAFQNKKYGAGMRSHTEGSKQLTCTVCGEKKNKG